jgi:uncharacterized membrane protein
MTEQIGPLAGLTDAALSAMLKRAMLVTLILGAVAAAIVWIASDWRNASMLAIGAVISGFSILEWQRLIKLFNAKLDKQQTPRGAALVITLFLLRIVIFAAVIYVSLKCLRGSATALLCGLALALLAMGWEAIRLLRD